MYIKNWHINAVIGALAISSFALGVRYVEKTPVDSGVKMEDTASYTLIREPLNHLKRGIISRDVSAVKEIVKGNGFEMSDGDYKTFLNQFKSKSDVTLFINTLENQAAPFVREEDLSSNYYYLDGSVEDLVLRVNKVKVHARFGTNGSPRVNDVKVTLNHDRQGDLPDTLPFNIKYEAEVGENKDSETLDLFDMFIGKDIYIGSGLDSHIMFFEDGAGLVVHIDTNVDNAILYVNGNRSNRTVSSGGCFRDGFKEGDTIRLEFGGKKSKEFKVSENKLSAKLDIDVGDFLDDDTIPKDAVNAGYIAELFLKAISGAIESGNTSEAEKCMASGYEHVVQQALQPLFNQYETLNFNNIFVRNTNVSGNGNTVAEVTFVYDGVAHDGATLNQQGVASIQIDVNSKIIGFTLH